MTELKDDVRTFEIIGAPFDGAATLGWPGSRYAPERIRQALQWMTMRAEGGRVYAIEDRSLIPAPRLLLDSADVDVVPHDLMATLDAAAAAVSASVRAGRVPILLGGDDSLLFAGVKGLHDAVDGSVGIVHFDAHLDMVDHNPRQGSFSQSSGMRRALGLPRVAAEDTVQLGIRHFNFPSSWAYIEQEGPAQITASDLEEIGVRAAVERVLERTAQADHIFFSFDIDVVDPAHAPGAGAHEPGGLTSRQAIDLVKALAPHCDGFAMTEVNPLTDLHDLTSNLAAYLCYYFAAYGSRAVGR